MARLLSMGATGLDVLELQSALNFHIRSPATPLKPDMDFGPLTDARLREFQRLAGIQVDGIVGPATTAALYRALEGTVEASLTTRETELPHADFVPPSPREPQDRSAASEGFEVESKLSFSPLSPLPPQLTLTITQKLPWPVFLSDPLELDIEIDQDFGDFQLAGKIKVPFKLTKSGRLELTPYFSVGAGVLQNNFEELNVGAGAYVKLKLLNNIGGSSVSLGLEADGGTKFNWEMATGEIKLKGFIDGAVTLGWLF